MRDVIQRVIAAEAEAKKMVQSARSEAEQILSAAQSQAQAITAMARREAQLEAGAMLAAATRDAALTKQSRLASFAAEIENQVHLDAVTRQQAVAVVVRCVCG